MLNNIGYTEFSPPKNISNCNQLDNDECISNSKCKLITTASGNKKCRKLNASSHSSSNKTQKNNKVFFETPLKTKSKKQQYDLEKQKLEQGKQTTILGMNPFVAIGVSVLIIVVGIVAVVKLKQK